MTIGLDDKREKAQQERNRNHTIALVAGLAGLMGLCAWLLWSWAGVLIAFLAAAVMLLVAPKLPPEGLMRLYGARRLDPRHGAQITGMVEILASRAGLAAVPDVYVVPSLTINAFASGSRVHATIAVTEGMLRKLSLRELAGVLAHEMSHVRNDDLWVMGIADLMTRVLRVMSWAALVLAVLYLPAYLGGSMRMPWAGLALAYFAPALGNLLQLGLSRTREYDADLDGVVLTGDPAGLASALWKLERYQGSLIEDLMPSGRRIPQPSLIRSHPDTEDRIARLKEVSKLESTVPPMALREEPMVSLVGLGPSSMRPRFRLPAFLWY